jgi:hypothetical protein
VAAEWAVAAARRELVERGDWEERELAVRGTLAEPVLAVRVQEELVTRRALAERRPAQAARARAESAGWQAE